MRPEVLALVFGRAAAPSPGFRLPKPARVRIFGTTKIVREGRLARSPLRPSDCYHALVHYATGGALKVNYLPVAMGSNVWWRN